MSVAYGTGPKGKATRLHAEITRARGVCEACARFGPLLNKDGSHAPSVPLECAHIVSRTYSNTRTSLDNSFALCSAHHRHFTGWPLEFSVFVVEMIGEQHYRELRSIALENRVWKQSDWVDEVARLQAIKATIEAAA